MAPKAEEQTSEGKEQPGHLSVRQNRILLPISPNTNTKPTRPVALSERGNVEVTRLRSGLHTSFSVKLHSGSAFLIGRDSLVLLQLLRAQ